MPSRPYYVYALKDPRSSPAMPFYIGKGTGARAHEHVLKPDGTKKGKRIRDIESSGQRVLVVPLVTGLAEAEAIRIEAELIVAFGTEKSGGCLTNTVVPSGSSKHGHTNVVLPQGVVERTQIGLTLLKDAILELALANPDGVTNAQVARELGLQSESGGGQQDYLSYSALGLLMRDGRIQKRGRRYFSNLS